MSISQNLVRSSSSLELIFSLTFGVTSAFLLSTKSSRATLDLGSSLLQPGIRVQILAPGNPFFFVFD
jgi:hypothetical protein